MVIWSWKERRHFVTKAHVKAIKMWNSIKTFKCAWYDSQQLVAAGLRSGLSAHKYDGKSNPASRGHLPQYPIVDDANAGKTCRRTRFHTTHNNLFFSDVPVLYSMGFRVAYSMELDVFHVFRTQYCSIIALRKQFGFNQSINQSINQSDGSRQSANFRKRSSAGMCNYPEISCLQVCTCTYDGLRFCSHFSVRIHETFLRFRVSKNVRFALT